MDKAQFKEFMKDQTEKIFNEKTKADKKAGKDLGDGFIHDWINNNSAIFRKQWKKDHTGAHVFKDCEKDCT